jgi:hypothetical protein
MDNQIPKLRVVGLGGLEPPTKRLLPRDEQTTARSHSASLDHRRRPEALRTAMCLLLSNQYEEPLPPGDAGVEEVPMSPL